MEYGTIQNTIDNLKQRITTLEVSYNLKSLNDDIMEFEANSAEPGFWDNAAKAQDSLQQLAKMKNKRDTVASLSRRLEDAQGMLEICKNEGDEKEADHVYGDLTTLGADLDTLELATLLAGKHDRANVVFSITSGAGGTDAQDWAQLLLRMYIRWIEAQGYVYEQIDYSAGEEAGIKGATLLVKGDYAYGYLKSEKGVHRLVRLSPFNSSNKRQTSFASVEVIPEIAEEIKLEIRPEDLKVDVFRASGAGGQHINKTESAVRMTHLPTGMVVQCQNSRSQIENRESALRVLKSRLMERLEAEQKQEIADLHGKMTDIGWGNQIRSYVFHPYKLVKDLRTDYETSDVEGVMNGKLMPFIQAFLKQ